MIYNDPVKQRENLPLILPIQNFSFTNKIILKLQQAYSKLFKIDVKVRTKLTGQIGCSDKLSVSLIERIVFLFLQLLYRCTDLYIVEVGNQVGLFCVWRSRD
mgnify:CR=1 FL=1